MTALAKLAALQQKYVEDAVREREAGADADGYDDPTVWAGAGTMLLFAPTPHGIHVEYHGPSCEDDALTALFDVLVDPEVAGSVASLSLTGPDEGANGTREWILTPLLDTDVHFPALRRVYVRPTEPDDHNFSLIGKAGAVMEEQGEIARLCRKAPRLAELTVPNAPDASFFTVPLPALGFLRIGGGYDTQRFVANLARASNLPSLYALDFSESIDVFLRWPEGEYPPRPTPFSAFEVLVGGRFSTQLRALTLRNTCLSRAELEALQARAPSLQLKVIQSTHGGYVQHFKQQHYPFAHLIQSAPRRA